MRGVTRFCGYAFNRYNKFQLTRLMRGVTGKKFNCSPSDKISTHTPHARRDEAQYQMTTDYVISTHTPHARRDKRVRFSLVASIPFQLTRLMRGVTHVGRIIGFFTIFQLTRLMRGVTKYAPK